MVKYKIDKTLFCTMAAITEQNKVCFSSYMMCVSFFILFLRLFFGTEFEVKQFKIETNEVFI